ncbi:MAG: rod shape-determining protein MreC [Candidatus Sulfobium sp.]|jgi:rod shape-determining protein MreC
MPKRRTFLFFAVVIIAFALMTYQSSREHARSGDFLNVMLDNSHAAVHYLGRAIAAPFRKFTLREEENARLRRRVDELLRERQKYREALLENRRLRGLLDLRDEKVDFVAAAEVIGKSVDRWSRILVIDKGSEDGVRRDMAAVTPLGLAGKVLNVAGSYSDLLPVTDINFSAAVRLEDSRKEGVLSGTGGSVCMLRYVPQDEDVKVGEVVITSGLDRLFPPGIPAGYVSKVDRESRSGMFQYIEVTPFQDGAKLEEVAIVK